MRFERKPRLGQRTLHWFWFFFSSMSEDGLIDAVDHLHFHLRSARPVLVPPPQSPGPQAATKRRPRPLRLRRVGVIRASKVAFDAKLFAAFSEVPLYCL